jgi:2-oxoglutarate ferredoxin oxidoreductase subunit delta
MTLAPARPASWTPLTMATERCKGCELCIVACPQGILALDASRTNGLGHHPIRLLDAGRCTSCAFCARVCPDAVFTVYAPPRTTERKAARRWSPARR